MDYTAIGDDVNLAARLEGVNKIYGTRIIIGENTYEQLSERLLCRELDYITVVGKVKPLKVYELLGELDNISEAVREHFKTYEKALNFYREGDFVLAKSIFEQINGERVNLHTLTYTETAAGVMAARCSQLIDNEPKEWSGIFKMDVK